MFVESRLSARRRKHGAASCGRKWTTLCWGASSWPKAIRPPYAMIPHGRRSSHLIERVDASRKNVRNFGFLFGGISVALAAYMIVRGNGAWVWALAAAAVFAAGGAFAFPLMKPVYTVWM